MIHQFPDVFLGESSFFDVSGSVQHLLSAGISIYRSEFGRLFHGPEPGTSSSL